MALIQENSNFDFIRPSDLSENGQLFKITNIEKKSVYDQYKKVEVERYFLTLENQKVFAIQNETNLNRLLWNFASIKEALGEYIWLYNTEIEVNGKITTVIRIRYNIFNKIKR